jgi:large subunit ribosomal protein L29
MKDSFKELTLKELLTKREEMKKEYRDLRFDLIVGHVNNPVKKRVLHRQLARLNTIIHEYELGIRREQE